MLLKPIIHAGWECLLIPFRLCNVLALLIHGFGHAFLMALVTGNSRMLNLHTVLEQQSPRDLLFSLLPTYPLPQFSPNPPRLTLPELSPWQTRWVSAAGIVRAIIA